MDLKIGIVQSTQVLDVELAVDADREALKADIAKVMSDADAVFWVTDKKGRDYGVPAARIAFVQLGGVDEDRHIGFGA